MPLPPWMASAQGSSGLRQNLNFNFNSNVSKTEIPELFPDFQGTTQVHQYSLTSTYTIGKGAWTHTLSFNYNYSDATTKNLYTEKTDVAQMAGIATPTTNPFFYGLPTLQFSQFSSGDEVQPSYRLNNVLNFGDSTSWVKRGHNVRLGGDVRRIMLDVEGGVQGTGQFTFTGCQTEAPTPTGTCSVPTPGQPQTGLDFADFLISLPTRANLSAGNLKYFLRGNEWDLFAQDTWHAKDKLTVLYGLRYEYFSPYAELHDHLANLDPNASFTDVAVVLPNQTGPYNGKYPHTLVNPDRTMFSPRLGIAYKATSKTVVRAGYGINYNTSQYQNFIANLAYEPPFAASLNNTQNPNDLMFTMANGLTNAVTTCPNGSVPPACITNNYAVDKNYRLGYVQVWNLDIQETLPHGILLNVGYNGSKGTHLDALLAPNRIINVGPTTPNAQVFDYEVSEAGSSFNALVIRARRRLMNGVAGGVTYTYSHSIDDAASIGGSTQVVAQQPLNLHDDEGNSAFDQRHVAKGDWTWELPFGKDQKYLNTGNWVSKALTGLQWYGVFTFATGTPLNPIYQASGADALSGVTTSLRPDRVPGSSLAGGAVPRLEWFNTAAFASPCTTDPTTMMTTCHYGSASRNSIPGPGVKEVDMYFSKFVNFGDTKSMEFRVEVNNIFNIVQFNGVSSAIGSFNAGQVTSAAQMRNLLLLVRYRF
jgi:hypothetical protein